MYKNVYPSGMYIIKITEFKSCFYNKHWKRENTVRLQNIIEGGIE